ncbi:TraR/DksA family transcriptional regulator [Brevundimonas sp.]|uniref:TraR/DksA family transcriptional regulator n=1 Tax=Brevundimonas sp. TaxID=1871086 RepID=UPI003D6D2F26
MDDADHASRLTDQEVDRRLAEIRRQNASHKGEPPALRICTDCDDPIEAARLAAQPQARRCIACQRLTERRPTGVAA